MGSIDRVEERRSQHRIALGGEALGHAADVRVGAKISCTTTSPPRAVPSGSACQARTAPWCVSVVIHSFIAADSLWKLKPDYPVRVSARHVGSWAGSVISSCPASPAICGQGWKPWPRVVRWRGTTALDRSWRRTCVFRQINGVIDEEHDRDGSNGHFIACGDGACQGCGPLSEVHRVLQGWAECVANNGADHPICQHKQLVCDQICAWEIPVVGIPSALDAGGREAPTGRLELAVAMAKRLSSS